MTKGVTGHALREIRRARRLDDASLDGGVMVAITTKDTSVIDKGRNYFSPVVVGRP